MDATARILAKRGYAGTNTNLVAEIAGVSIGSLYQYFPNKESLIVALHQRHAERLSALADERMAVRQGQPLEECIRAVVHAVMEVHLENPELERMLETELSYLDLPADGEGDSATLFDRTHSLLKEHRAEIGPRDLALANRVVSAMVKSLVHEMLFNYHGTASITERETAIVDAVMGYLTYVRSWKPQPEI